VLIAASNEAGEAVRELVNQVGGIEFSEVNTDEA